MTTRFTKPTAFQTKLFINNEFCDGHKKTTIPVINPCTEERICEISEATERDVEFAIDAALTALPKWSHTSYRERSTLLYRLADLIERDIDTLICLESFNCGKPLSKSESDMHEVICSLRYFAGWADKITGKSYNCSESSTFCYTRREPYGVIGLVSPSNSPLIMCEWRFAPALITGNCVVHKPSEETPLSILWLCRLFKEAGFPPGVYNCVPGHYATAGETLARSQRVSKIFFTGSTVEGRKIMEASCSTNLKDVSLTLGGKTPFIVCPDSDLDKAVSFVWNSIMYNVGECWLTGSRLFIHETVYEEFIRKLKAFESSVKIGCVFTGCNHGPQINLHSMNKVLGYFDHARTIEKLDCIMGGERFGNKGYFIKPTVYVNVDDSSRLACEEIHGPVLVILKPWRTLEEVISRVNNTKYGMTGFILSNTMSVTDRLVREIHFGSIFVNTFCYPKSFLPYRGFKESSFGSSSSCDDVVYDFTQLKSVYCSYDEPKC